MAPCKQWQTFSWASCWLTECLSEARLNFFVGAMCFAKYCVYLVTNATSLVNWSKSLVSNAAASMSVAGAYDLNTLYQRIECICPYLFVMQSTILQLMSCKHKQ